MNTKLVARNPKTGRYFDGVNFDNIESNALALRPGTTADDFKLSWSAPVEVIEIQSQPESLAMRIHNGELTRHEAAAEYVRKTRRENGQKEFIVRTPTGKYISRRVFEPQKGIDRSAWVKFQGCEIAIIWSQGELAIDSL